MIKLIFATNNQHKVDEMRSIVTGFDIITLKEAGILIDIPEPYNTLEANARNKSAVIHHLTQMDCFSEDTGLEVKSLNGEPGVKSARYAGESSSADDNINKLLAELGEQTNRQAQFRTILSLILNESEHTFEGICKGTIIAYKRGEYGFGYDAIFVPDGSNKTFAEMELVEKNQFSHRKKALKKMVEFLISIN